MLARVQQAVAENHKVSAAVVGGSLATIIVWIVDEFTLHQVPAEVGSALGAFLSMLSAMLIPEKDQE